MFGLEPLWVGIGLVVFLLLEAALFWAAAAIGDAPPLTLGKTLAVGCGVGLVTSVALYLLATQTGLTTQRPAYDSATGMFTLLGLASSWAIAAVLYVPLVPASVGKSLLMAVFQLLLRGLLYALLTGVVMVVLAVLEIVYNKDASRSELLLSTALGWLCP